MSDTLLDDFHDLGPWTAVAPGAAKLALSTFEDEHGRGLRLDYDLGGNGFVIARRALALALPEDYAFTLDTRGAGAQHIVEFKLIDERLANVWRLREENFALNARWTPWRITAADIGYAWGAHRARRLAHCDALELAIVGAGQGTLCLRALHLHDETYRGTPRVSASSALPAHAAQHVLQDDDHGWQSAGGGEQTLSLAFEAERAFSALHIDWQRDARPSAFAIDIADSNGAWQTRHEAPARPGPRSTVLLPGTRARAVRVRMSADAHGAGIRHLAFEPWYYAPTLFDGLSALAMAAPRGQYPKALCEQQSYWTVTGAAAGSGVALLNTEGLLEVDHGDFAIEAFVRVGTRLYGWADVTLTAQLEDDYLPLPSVGWQGDDFSLAIAPVMTGSAAEACLHVDYHLINHGAQAREFTLYLLVRPYLVTPIWQIWQGRGGIAPLHAIDADAHGLRINNARSLYCATAADDFGAAGFAGGDIVDGLRAGVLPAAVHAEDGEGLASAVLAFICRLDAGGSQIISCRVPARGASTDGSTDVASHDKARSAWRALLGPSPITLPAAHASAILTLRTAAAHILVNRDGPRLQPGPRRYVRAYLRDAVGMGTALARLGIVQPLKDLLDWYGPWQRADGELPDAIDDDGAEWLPEYDAYGQYLHGVAEAQRLAPEPAFLARQWPRVQRVLARFEQLRAMRCTDAYRDSAYFGVLPESMSHEGYMAQPVHAYWDDFWALRGLNDATWLANEVGAHEESRRIATLATHFADCLHRSLALTMAHHAIEFIPGSVELGDFDATAIAVALTVADDGAQLPRAALDATFDRYLAIRAARVQDNNWSNYSAYEIRIVGALIRLNRRKDALRVLHDLLADCRPPAWRQWPEQSWRVYEAPAFLGDLPHSWIGAEYIHALGSAFAFERHADNSLVIAAGIDPNWLDSEGVTVEKLVTHHGLLSYRLWRREDGRIEMHIEAGIELPRGGLVLMPPLDAGLRAVTLNGQAHQDFDDHSCRCHALPAQLVFYCEEART